MGYYDGKRYCKENGMYGYDANMRNRIKAFLIMKEYSVMLEMVDMTVRKFMTPREGGYDGLIICRSGGWWE